MNAELCLLEEVCASCLDYRDTMSALTEIDEEIARCHLCEIARNRTHAVPGEGAEDADIVFIGEGPGWHEDQQGRPFVGPAGKYLEELLALVGMKREQVYITNVIKCRAPGNRDPLPVEIQTCRRYLDRQIELIHPRLIVALGRYSMARFFPGESISKAHGTWRKRDDVIIYAMYHPAAALHQQSLKRAIEADMLKIPQILAQAENLAPQEQPAQQLSLF